MIVKDDISAAVQLGVPQPLIRIVIIEGVLKGFDYLCIKPIVELL